MVGFVERSPTSTLEKLILQEAARGNCSAPRVAVPTSSMFDASCPSPSAAPVRRSAGVARRSAGSRRAVMVKRG